MIIYKQNNNECLERLTRTGPKRLHVLYKYILSKFSAYNMNSHTQTDTRTRANTHTHARKHARTHARTHAHAHTHTYTHTHTWASARPNTNTSVMEVKYM